MIKLKGGDDKHSIMNEAAKRMNLPQLNGSKSQGQPGLGSAGQMSGPGSYSAGAPSSGGQSSLAERLGMPSVKKENRRREKDWSNKSNRINVGGPVFIRSARDRNDGGEGEDSGADSDRDETGGDSAEIGVEGSEEEKVLAELRERRLAELKKSTQKQLEFQSLGHGQYSIITEDEFLPSVTQSKYSICHFFHANFERCKIMDKHLDLLAKKHFATRFISINAEKTPFFVKKLQVKTLPTVVLFKDGIAIDRIIGFEDLGGDDNFETAALEKRLSKAGVIITVDKVTEEDREKSAEEKRKAASKIREAKIKQFVNYDSDEDSDMGD